MQYLTAIPTHPNVVNTSIQSFAFLSFVYTYYIGSVSVL